MTQPVREVIPREIPENVIPTLNMFSETLDEFVNFGSHILNWDANPNNTGEENVAPTMLFRHFLDLIDTISILVKHSCGDTSKLIIRGALETTFGIEYLFEKDTYNRAMAFLVTDVISQIKTLKRLNPKTVEGKELYNTFEKEKFFTKAELFSKYDLDDHIKSKEGILQLPQFKKASDEYDQLRKNGEKNPKWYRLFGGPRNFEALSAHLKQKTLYELLYRKWSGAVHGSDIYLGKLSHNELGGVDIVQLRYIKDVQEVVKYAMTLSLKVFRLFIDNRLPEKQTVFKEWYLTIREKYLMINQRILITVE